MSDDTSRRNVEPCGQFRRCKEVADCPSCDTCGFTFVEHQAMRERRRLIRQGGRRG